MYIYQKIEGVNYPLFYFKTPYEFEYTVSFLKMDSDLIKEIPVYSICLNCIKSGSSKKDEEVGKTVCMIIKDFMSQNKKSLLAYVCDSVDNKHKARQRVFEKWYIKFVTGNYILRNYDVYIEEYNLIYYSSVIFDCSVYTETFINETYGKALKQLARKN